MRLFRYARQHPLALLGVVAVVFIGWIWWDAIASRTSEEAAHVSDPNRRRELPLPPEMYVDGTMEPLVPPPPPPEQTRGIPKLKPGMPRIEVEKLVGAPADRVSPATVADGRVTYSASYEADFGPPPTVRPIRAGYTKPPLADPTAGGRMLVTLEFDATKPGHPLLDIHYPDPLF